ncbi:MAG: hypothetical protein GY774_38780, partial [Planctomycetes bacterium]|nr:hypothetical protein [Planctomycetota bacterium]
ANYSCLELDFPKCKHLKKNPESSVCSFQGTPKPDPERSCGTSGTADTHEYHLERIVKKMVTERGYEELDLEDDANYPEQPRAYFLVQMDKSTCQTYKHATNFFDYREVPTKRTQLLLEEIAELHGVFIITVCQPTHLFDAN